MYRFFLLLFAFCGLLTWGTAYAQTASIGVVYPEVREPYRSVFEEIVRGMEKELGQPVTRYILSDQQNGADLSARMKNDRIEAVVTLGRAGFEVAQTLSPELPVIVGAIILPLGQNSQGLSGISLTPDPQILFARLKELAPAIKEVNLIYDPEQNPGEIARARDAAQTNKLNMHALQSTDLRRSAAIYRRVLQKIKKGSAAIWLPQDNRAMDDQALLPLVLSEAWQKRFVVFSGNLNHVRKGALFSLYPDNFGMGRSLAIMIRSRTQKGSTHSDTIEPLRDLLTAVNLRTAEHLGLNFDNTAKHKFGMTFPPRP